MPNAVNESPRETCLREHRHAVELGCFLLARGMLRDALVWRSQSARIQSMRWGYVSHNGKMHAFQYKHSF